MPRHGAGRSGSPDRSGARRFEERGYDTPGQDPGRGLLCRETGDVYCRYTGSEQAGSTVTVEAAGMAGDAAITIIAAITAFGTLFMGSVSDFAGAVR